MSFNLMGNKIFLCCVLIVLLVTITASVVLANDSSRESLYKNALTKYQQSQSDYRSASGAARVEDIKTYLFNVISVSTEYLYLTKEKIDTSEYLSDEEKANFNSQLNQKISELDGNKSEADQISDSSSAQEVSNKISNSWQGARAIINQVRGTMYVGKMNNIVEKINSVILEIEKNNNALGDSNQSKVEISSLIENAKADLRDASTNSYSALELFSIINSDPDNADTLFNEGKSKIESGRVSLKQAVKTLREASHK